MGDGLETEAGLKKIRKKLKVELAKVKIADKLKKLFAPLMRGDAKKDKPGEPGAV